MATSSSASTSQSQSSSFLPTWLQGFEQVAQDWASQQYQWASNAYNADSSTIGQLVNELGGAGTANLGQANQMWNRYQTAFQPQEDSLMADANSYNSTARQQYEMGRAGSQATQAGTAQMNAAKGDLESYGVDPSAGRFAGLEEAERLQTAASATSAENQAQQATAAAGRGLRSEAIQVGERYPGQVINAMGQALGDATGAANATLANTSVGTNALNAANAATNTALHPTTETQSTSTSQSASAGGGGGGGSGGGMFTDPTAGQPLGGTSNFSGSGSNVDFPLGANSQPGYSAPDLSFSPVMSNGAADAGNSANFYGGTSAAFAAQGGSPDDAPPLPVDGGQVPMGASPSMGQQTDDVPARLNAGEFVIPKDVAAWKGHEFFQKLIQQSRKARAAPDNARPQLKPSLHQPPSFRTAGAGVLPMR